MLYLGGKKPLGSIPSTNKNNKEISNDMDKISSITHRLQSHDIVGHVIQHTSQDHMEAGCGGTRHNPSIWVAETGGLQV